VISKKTILVGALVVVAESEFDGIPYVAEATIFGTAELDAAGDFTVVDIEAGDNALSEHGCGKEWRGTDGKRGRV